MTCASKAFPLFLSGGLFLLYIFIFLLWSGPEIALQAGVEWAKILKEQERRGGGNIAIRSGGRDGSEVTIQAIFDSVLSHAPSMHGGTLAFRRLTAAGLLVGINGLFCWFFFFFFFFFPQ